MKIDDGSDKIDFSIRFKDVDKPVTIDAPSSGKPIEELGEKLEAGVRRRRAPTPTPSRVS